MPSYVLDYLHMAADENFAEGHRSWSWKIGMVEDEDSWPKIEFERYLADAEQVVHPDCMLYWPLVADRVDIAVEVEKV